MSVLMKKILLRSLVVVVVLVIVTVVAVGLSLDSAIKKGVETFGPQVAKVPVTLDKVSLSLFSGSAALRGLAVGNPEGYKTTNAISLGLASVAVSPGSIFSDKVVVKSIRIEAPKVTFEFGPGGSNLQRIQKNLEAFSGPGATNQSPTAESPAPAATDSKPGKKLQVDEIVITGGTVTVGAALLGGKIIEAPLPEIHFENLGQGPDGITGAELGKLILAKITEESLKAYGDRLSEAGAEALQNLSQNATNAAQTVMSNALNKASKGLGDLLTPKK